MYGAGPSLLWLGQGLQRTPQGGNAMRASGLLPAITGNLGRPGAGFLYLNGTDGRGVDHEWLAGTGLGLRSPPSISQMDLAAALEDPARAQALVCWNINIAASNPQQARLRAALEREDLFTVVLELFPTDTADLADIVLPAASFLEHDDLVMSYFDLTVSAQVKAGDRPATRSRTRRSSGASPPPWASTSRSCTRAMRRCSRRCCAAPGWRRTSPR